MLPDFTLEHLTRNAQAPICEALVTLAWPSFSTESKLQVLDKIAARSWLGNLPTWLSTLALADVQPVVRLWAANRTDFVYKKRWEDDWGDDGLNDDDTCYALEPDEPSKEALRLASTVAQDSCELVRLAERQRVSDTSFGDLRSLSRVGRLLAIRRLRRPRLYALVEWLEDAAQGGISDEELSETINEFFEHPYVLQGCQNGDTSHATESTHDEDEQRMDAMARIRAIDLLPELSEVSNACLATGLSLLPSNG